MARLRLVVQKSTVINGGTPVLETRHHLQAVAGPDCDTDAAAFLALDNKQAQTTTDVPTNLPNKHWVLRDCPVTPAGDTYVDASNDDYIPPTNPGGGNGDPGSSNPADESNAVNYTSTSNNDGGPI
jgi:hypothetical protein